jgi:hypothetical protein
MDPLSLEPLSELPYPPFELRGDVAVPSPETDYFDSCLLATFLVSVAKFVHPVTQRSLTRAECEAIEADARSHGHPAPLTAAYDLHHQPYCAELAALSSMASGILLARFTEPSVRWDDGGLALSAHLSLQQGAQVSLAAGNVVDSSSSASRDRRRRRRRRSGRKSGRADESSHQGEAAGTKPAAGASAVQMEASESDEGSGGDDNGPGPPDHLVAHPLLAARTPETLLRHLVGEDSDEVCAYVCTTCAEIADALRGADASDVSAERTAEAGVADLVALLDAHQVLSMSKRALRTIVMRLVALAPREARAPSSWCLGRAGVSTAAGASVPSSAAAAAGEPGVSRPGAVVANGIRRGGGRSLTATASSASRPQHGGQSKQTGRGCGSQGSDSKISGRARGGARRAPSPLVRLLTELAPRVSRELCRFVVDEIYDGDVEEAVDTLLHVPAAELESRRAEATERRLAMEAKEAMRAKLAKRRVLSRHARVRDHVADGESVFDLCKPHVKAYVASRKQALATPAIRYLEGAVVSRSGEREIVERAPAWDGGSRGRIVASQRSHYTPREPPTRAPDPGAGKKGR